MSILKCPICGEPLEVDFRDTILEITASIELFTNEAALPLINQLQQEEIVETICKECE